MYIAVAANDDAAAAGREGQAEARRSPRPRCRRKSRSTQAQHGWCVPDTAVYSKAEAERAWGKLLALYKRRRWPSQDLAAESRIAGRTSVWTGRLRAIDDDHLHGAARCLEPKTELFLNCGEEREAVRRQLSRAGTSRWRLVQAEVTRPLDFHVVTRIETRAIEHRTIDEA